MNWLKQNLMEWLNINFLFRGIVLNEKRIRKLEDIIIKLENETKKKILH